MTHTVVSYCTSRCSFLAALVAEAVNPLSIDPNERVTPSGHTHHPADNMDSIGRQKGKIKKIIRLEKNVTKLEKKPLKVIKTYDEM